MFLSTLFILTTFFRGWPSCIILNSGLYYYYYHFHKQALTFSGGKNLSKLFVTLHIRNVTVDDDGWIGPLGRYECHAYAVADPEEKKRGFAVNVIRRKLPFFYQHRNILSPYVCNT